MIDPMTDWLPVDDEQSQVQIEHILQFLGEESRDIVDVGCGDGILLIPMAVSGHRVTGIDIDSTAIDACSKLCADIDLDVQLIKGDLFRSLPLLEPVDVIVCCGQTFMLFADVEEAVNVLSLFNRSLKRGGMVILDDIPGDLWPEIAQGRWANGVNEDESLQLVWSENDVIFAIREGDQVDVEVWELKESDQKLRLWTMGALQLAATVADLSAPEVPFAGAILVMRAD